MFLLLFVCLVSMNLLMIKTEEKIIRIEIKKAEDHRQKCVVKVVPSEVTLDLGSNFTLEVRSVYFIKHSYWDQQRKHRDLQKLKNSKFTITYERSIFSKENETNNIHYTYFHTRTVMDSHARRRWNFTFQLIRNYDPWTFDDQQYDVQDWWCNTSVLINPSRSTNTTNIPAYSGYPNPSRSTNTTNIPAYSGYPNAGMIALITVVCILGILLLVQSSFIIYGKARSSKSNRNDDKDPISPKSPRTKRGDEPRRNIADRPPLPLPPNEAVTEEPIPPSMSPIPKRHHLFPQATAPSMPVGDSFNCHAADPPVHQQSYTNKGLNTSDGRVKSPAFTRKQMEGPLLPIKSYKNKGLDNSYEDRSPGFSRRHMEGSLVPKQSFRNKALDNSDEEIGTPGFARRQIEAKFAQLPPKGVPPSTSFKLPKPLPRPPDEPSSPPPEQAPPFNPAHRKDPRLSDEDWQYEQLQPATKYLNNVSDLRYGNVCRP